MNKSNIIDDIIDNYLKHNCRHDSISQVDDTSYCSDCGKKIKLGWIVLKCTYCNLPLLPNINNVGDISPLKKFCPNCKSEGWFSDKKEFISESEKQYGICIKEEIYDSKDLTISYETDSCKSKDDKTCKDNHDKHSTKIWIESSGIATGNKKSNIIKAKKNS